MFYITLNEICKTILLGITCFTLSTKCEFALTDFLLKYPYQSLVRLSAPTDNAEMMTLEPNETLCTGLIINSVYILTHAKCSEYTQYKGPYVTIVFVTSGIYSPSNTTMVRWINHESFRESPDKYDLALIELESFIPFTHFIHPAVLFHGDMHLVETELECAVVSWNDSLRTLDATLYFMLLTKVDVTVMKQHKCHKMYPKYSPVLCVIPKEPFDLCDMDLGTPLTCGVMNIWVFLGVYIGVNTCPSNDTVFVFRKLDQMESWVKRLANGAYVIDGNVLNKTRKSAAIPAHASGTKNYILSSTIFILGLYYFNRLH